MFAARLLAIVTGSASLDHDVNIESSLVSCTSVLLNREVEAKASLTVGSKKLRSHNYNI